NWVTRFNHADTSKLSPIAVAGDRNPAYSLGGNPQPVKVVRFRYLAHRSRRFAGCEYNELARRRWREQRKEARRWMCLRYRQAVKNSEKRGNRNRVGEGKGGGVVCGS